MWDFATKTLSMLWQGYSDKVMGQCFEWHRHFKSRRTSLEDVWSGEQRIFFTITIYPVTKLPPLLHLPHLSDLASAEFISSLSWKCSSKVAILTLLLRSRVNCRRSSTCLLKMTSRPDPKSGRNTGTDITIQDDHFEDVKI